MDRVAESEQVRIINDMEKNLVLLLFPRTGMDPLRPQPPLSLLVLAPYIEEKGLVPVIIDQRVEHDYKRKILEQLPCALFVAITSMTGEQLRYAVDLVDLVKEASPETPVVFGGIHASIMPEQTAVTRGVDLVAVGEGEGILPDIIDHYLLQVDRAEIAGLCFLENGKVIRTPGRDQLELDALKMPGWHLIDISRYTDFTVQCGRGCPHSCTFCYNKKFNNRIWRARSPAIIVDELMFLYQEYGVRDFHFIDDNFFTDFERVAELCALIIARDMRIRWKSSFRADYFQKLTPALVDLLKRSGLTRLFVGGESGSQEILGRIKKGIRVEDLLSAARVSRKYELPTSISFMAGFPFETQRDRKMTCDIMDEVARIYPGVSLEGINIYTPYPGTELFEESKSNGLREPASLRGWACFVFNQSNLPWFCDKENRMMMNISFIARFVFWDREIRERFLKIRYYPFYLVLRVSALVRWRLRLFSNAYEWDLFRFLSSKL